MMPKKGEYLLWGVRCFLESWTVVVALFSFFVIRYFLHLWSQISLTAFAGLPNFLFQGVIHWTVALLSDDLDKMGNDGGSIPDRRDLVKTKSKVCSTHKLHTLMLTSGNQGRTSRQSKPDESSLVLLRIVKGTFCRYYNFPVSCSSLSVNYKSQLYHVPSGNFTTKIP